MPDNGFGTKANSADFLLRLYLVTPDWETADGGAGAHRGRRVHLAARPRPPDPVPDRQRGDARPAADRRRLRHRVGRARAGRHVLDRRGVRPVPAPRRLPTARCSRRRCAFPGGKSPPNPYLAAGETPRVPASRGFEAMAASANGRYLYPIVEGAFVDDPTRAAGSSTSSTPDAARYTGRTWQYEVDSRRQRHRRRLHRPERPAAGHRARRLRGPGRGDQADLRGRPACRPTPTASCARSCVVDLLRIANPDGIGSAASPGAYGVGDPFSFPLQSVETVVELRDGRLLVANDNNYPGNDARVPGTPDDTEMIIVDLPHGPSAGARATRS